MAVGGTISGHIYFDNNGNGMQDAGDAILGPNFPVDLYSADGSIRYATATTDVSGNFSFGQRAEGTYAIRFGTSGGFRGDLGTATADGANWLTGVTVGNGLATMVDQGFYIGGGGRVSGIVGFDANGNHQLDGGEGEAGVIVQARDQVGNLVGSTNTAGDGSYSFSGLGGVYTISVANPLGQAYVQGASQRVTASVTSDTTGKNFLLAAAPTVAAPSGGGSIGGHTFFDADGNLKQDANEIALPAGLIPVDLYNADGTVHYATTALDANGNYNFGHLADGNYAVRFGTSGGFQGDKGFQTADGANWITGVAVSNGAATTLDQGVKPFFSSTLVGNVFSDVDGNGRFGNLDRGLAGAIVTISDVSGHLLQSTTTDGNGSWNFGGLGGGDYTVAFAPGLNNVVVDGPSTITRTLVAGTTFSNETVLVTSANKVAVSLSGTVFADANGNHTLDGGEAGVAGANVAVIDSGGFVVATVTTDQNGHYVLPHPEAGAGYRVVVSPPTGYAVEDLKGATSLTLTAGQPLDHVDLGLKTAAPPVSDAPPPVSKVINVVLRGQSNTYYPTLEGQVEVMRQSIQSLLGFDGVNQRVNLVATYDSPDNANTEWSGTGLTDDWLHPDGQTWASTHLERGYLSAINQIPATDRGAPTAIVMLHNEYDSYLSNDLTTARWMSAMTYEAGLARAVLGLDAGAAPYLFISPIAFPYSATQPVQNQAIAVGQAALSADPAFNAKVVALQTSDVTMDHDGYIGGAHLNTLDQQTVYLRAALGVAQEFAASAMPGSTISQANGDIDNLGPQVTQVAAVAGHANQLLLTVAFDQANSLQRLGTVAAAGVGWSVRSDYQDATAEAIGTAAQVVDANHVLLSFDNLVPAGERLFYSFGGLRLQQNNGPGNGNSIYDDNGLPLSVDPRGLAVGYVSPGGPTISGTVANQATAQASINPFATATLADPNTGATDTLRITMAGAGGTLSGTGLVATNDGAYTLSGSAASITAALHALTFMPSAGQTGTTTFALQAVSDAFATAAKDSTTSVVITPAAGITVALAHDTGLSSADGITADASLAVSSAPGTSLSYVVDGNAVAAYDPSTLKDGAHTVSVMQPNAGNASTAGPLAFTLDRTAPSLGADAASGTGVAAALTGHLLANDADATALHVVSVQYANGLSKAVPTVGGAQVDAANGTLTVAADGSYSFHATDPGRAVFTETVADAAGNTSQTTLTLNLAKAGIPASLSFGFALTEARFDFSHGHDLMTAPDGTVADLTGVATITFTDGTVQEKDGAGLVDDLYYDTHNLDVWRAHVDPDAHYAANGWHEGRDPNAYFSTSGYLAANPDVAKAGVNPLTHYDANGWKEGRSPGADFSAEAYLAVNPDVAKAGIDPLAHYLDNGQAEGRAVLPGLTVAQGGGDHLYGDFDATYYLAHNPDVAAAARTQGGSADSFAFTHYLTFGAHEGRDPDALFSTNGYLAANPNVAASGGNPLLHYQQEGWFQGRDPSASFHTDAYLTANPDVAAAGMDPLHHYLQFGQAEGRHLA